jgi:phosphomannomutase/phosphoglucomutase
MAKYFGTNGVRGRFDFLGPDLAMKLAKAIGVYFGKGRVLLARDGRLTGECLKHAIIAGLQSVGCNVIDMDYAPAPTAEFMIKKLKANGLIIITASHNPPEWNAMKVIDGNGITVSSERGEEIEALIDCTGCSGWQNIGKTEEYKEGIYEHMKEIKRHIDSNKIQKKIVLDCGNGMAAMIAPQLFKELGCNVIVLNGTVDGRFPGRLSEPSEANVDKLMKTVTKERADAGFAWDGDGDRVIAVDENGEYIIGDRVFALSVLLKLREKKGSVVTTVATSRAAEDIAKAAGCPVRYTKIGAPYLSMEMAAKMGGPFVSAEATGAAAVIGGEEVGGVIWPEISLAKDGFMTAAKITEALCEKPLSKWIMEIPHYCNSKTKIKANSEQKTRIIEGMQKYADEEKLKIKMNTIDGVRIDFSDSWVIVRSSGTEEYVRVFAEAKNVEMAKELMKKYVAIAEKFIKK